MSKYFDTLHIFPKKLFDFFNGYAKIKIDKTYPCQNKSFGFAQTIKGGCDENRLFKH